MGFCQSKETSGTDAAPGDSTTSSTPKTHVPNPVEAVTGALEAFHHRTSVIDGLTLAKQLVTTTTEAVMTKGHRGLKNVFAAPLEDVADFKAPVYPKTAPQKAFIKKAILQNFVFSQMHPDEIKTMIAAFEKVSFNKDALVIKQGEEGDYFYVIESGKVGFTVNDKPVGEPAGPGQTFGELALLYSAPRAATCVALGTKNILYRVDQKTFRYILQSQTQTADKTKRDLLKNISFLKELDEVDLGKLASNLTPRVFVAGEVLVKKGDDGDAFYVIQEGKVNVKDIEVGGQTYEDIQLGAGEFFGERALILKEPRTANCIAATAGIAMYVDSDTFTKVMGNLSQLVLKASDKRRLEALKVFHHTAVDPSDFISLAELIIDTQLKVGHIIFEEGESTFSTLYIVRDGQVKLTSTSSEEYNGKIINEGGFFGEDMLMRDAKTGENKSTPTFKANYTATVMEDCTVGLLTLEECRAIFDTTKMGKSDPSFRRESIKNEDISLKSLKRHAILGAGTFGQVWLVSRTSSDGNRKAYALKIQSKYELIRNSQATGVVQEKNIMAQLSHPFIINMVTTFQDKRLVYMLLGLVQGGELFSIMHKASFDGIPEKDTKFYAAGIFEGLSYMHRRHILYRDLKPENVLIDETGYPVIVDLGFAKYVKEKTYTLCGTPLYIAPEVVLNRGHDKGADHWSLGVMIFEMISGNTPFYKDGMDQITLFRAIVKGNFKYPRNRNVRKEIFSENVKDLISKMLVVDPTQRYGSLAHGEKDIYRAPWFENINFNKLKMKEIPAPWIPKIKDPLDTSNFENWDHLDDKAKAKDPAISAKHNDIFKTF